MNIAGPLIWTIIVSELLYWNGHDICDSLLIAWGDFVMNIQQVIYVMEVYDYHSFTEAAKALYISQPRLSQAIRELEDELGFEIFERNRKGISGTTVKGYEFIEQARTLLKQFHSLESLKERNSSSFSLSTTLLTQSQDAFFRLCKEQIADPHLNTDLWFCGCNETADRVRSLASDIGVITIIDSQFEDWMYYFKKNNIEYHELSYNTAYVTISKDSPLASQSVVYTDDLTEYTYIAERCSRMNDLTLKVYALIDSICPDTRITVSNTDIMYRLASATPENRTFVFDPIPPSQKTLDQYGLVTIPFEDSFKAHLGYIVLKDHSLSPLALRFIELLTEEVREAGIVR